MNCKYCERAEIKFSSELAEEKSQIDLTENTARKESSPLEVYSVNSNRQCKIENTDLRKDVGVCQGELLEPSLYDGQIEEKLGQTAKKSS